MRRRQRRSCPRGAGRPPCLKAHDVGFSADESRPSPRSTTMRSSSGMRAASALGSVVFPVPVPPEIRTFWWLAIAWSRYAATRRQRAEIDEVVEAVAARELPDGQDRPRYGARREHGGDPRSVLESGVEQWLHLGNLVTTGPRDVLDGDGQVPHLERAVGPTRGRRHAR